MAATSVHVVTWRMNGLDCVMRARSSGMKVRMSKSVMLWRGRTRVSVQLQ